MATKYFDRSYEHLFGDRIENPEKQHSTLVMGHRGGFTPHNSMSSFKTALDSTTVPIVELDVKACN
jgi:glycerophosphoryl diester phosphodiesterase